MVRDRHLELMGDSLIQLRLSVQADNQNSKSEARKVPRVCAPWKGLCIGWVLLPV